MCKKKKKDNKNVYVRSSGLSVTRLLLLSMLLISLTSIAAIVLMYYKENIAFVTGVEATLLSTGLSMIGLALSVWAGLNIANAIQRRDIDKLQDTIRTLDSELDDANKKWAGNQSAAMKNLFTQELMRSQTDKMSSLFCEEFFDVNDATIHWNILVEIERYYATVYELHSGLKKKNSLLIKNAEAGLDRIKKLPLELTALEKEYSLFREAEFNFYKGYVESGEESFYSFQSSIKRYLEYWEMRLGHIPEGQGTTRLIRENKELAVYLANTLGEAYSKILQKYDQYYKFFKTNSDSKNLEFLIECKEKAVCFGQKAVSWCEDTSYRNNEVIFRNLGCSYEGLDKAERTPFAHEKQIFETYQHAFRLMADDCDIKYSRVQNVYHVLLTYYKRYLEECFVLIKQNEKRETKKEMEAFTRISILKNNCDERTCQRCQEFITYADFARKDGKQNHFLIVMQGFAYFFAGLAVRNYSNTPENSSLYHKNQDLSCYPSFEDKRTLIFGDLSYDTCLKKVETAVIELRLLGCKDDYTTTLIGELEYLERMNVAIDLEPEEKHEDEWIGEW